MDATKLPQCGAHYYKIIFNSEESAEIFIRIFRVGMNMQVYPCPVKTEHFHIRDRTKRNRKAGKKTICPASCSCICHDGYGGEHPNERCPGKRKTVE